ncbi:MAG: hypothetical protein H7Y11_07535, partial [Armatimonadetes bacterium]|nr:hypothetical protein [Anaerolineae bacterium]
MAFRRLIVVIGLVGMVFTSVSVVMAAPVPNTSLSVPETVFIGESFKLSVTFDNTSAADVGYGPFIDLWLPRNGADGAAGTFTPDGIEFADAEVLGSGLNATSFVFPGTGNGCIAHPYLRDAERVPIEICGTSGDQFVVIELPFGSFAPAQPAVEVDVKVQMSDLADLGVPLTIRTRGGFRFGATPLDDPCCDAPITSPIQNANVTPKLLTISKTGSAPEDEIPAGENFPHTWTLVVDIADGQTISDLNVIDYLPPQVNYLDVMSAVPALSGPAVVAADRVTFNIASVTGGGGEDDVSITFSFYAPEVLDPVTGAPIQIFNSAQSIGNWLPNDPRDAATQGNADAFAECTALTCPGGNAPYILALAAQKSVAALSSPVRSGTTLEYTVNFQISDYFTFADFVMTDIISDGQHLDTGFTPVLSYTQHGATTSTPLALDNYTISEYWTGGTPGIPAVPPAVNGDTVLVVRISDQLGATPLLGGCIPPAGTPDPDCDAFNLGPTTGSLTYRTVILDQFVDNFPSGDASVDHGDLLTNQLDARAQNLNPANFSPVGYSVVNNDSEQEVEIERGALTKTLFAINGVPCGACEGVSVSVGETVTYRIRQEMPSSDFEDFRLVDFLPLPVYNA